MLFDLTDGLISCFMTTNMGSKSMSLMNEML
jgi:hypothetical protein